MANETWITVIGNATADPELRFTTSGVAVCNLTIASSERIFDKDTNEWKDAEQPLFMRCNVWRTQAENVAETIRKGDRVIAYGKLRQRNFETREGEKRTVVELEVTDIGPALLYATAQVSKRGATGAGGQRQSVSSIAEAASNFASAGFVDSSTEAPF